MSEKNRRNTFLIPTLVALLALGFLPSRASAQISSGEFEVLKKTIEGLQKQIQIQGQEIASLKKAK